MPAIHALPSVVVDITEQRALRRVMQDAMPSPAAQALAAFNALQAQCGSTTAIIDQAAFGPFSNSGSCSFDCGFKEQRWSWSADYTVAVKQNSLLPATQRLALAPVYGMVFGATTEWRMQLMPDCGNALIADIGTIVQTDAAIVAEGGKPTPLQQFALAEAFMNARDNVETNAQQMNGALQALAGFLAQQQPLAGTLPALGKSLQAEIDPKIAQEASNLINRVKCGGGTVQNQFNAMQGVVDASFSTLAAPLAALDQQLQEALDAGSTVTGTFLVLQSDNALVLEQLQNALSCDPTSPMRTIHLNMAQQNWGDLVSHANQQLSA